MIVALVVPPLYTPKQARLVDIRSRHCDKGSERNHREDLHMKRTAGTVIQAFVMAAGIALLGSFPQPAWALTVHNVTTTADVVAADGQISLREAFNAANSDGDASLIQLGAGLVYSLNICGVVPAHSTNGAGSLVHTSSLGLTINGQGSTIQQTCPFERVMRNSHEDAHITLNDLTLTGGQVTEMAVGDDGVENGGGGGLLSYGPVALDNVVLTGNTSLQGGGGLRALQATAITDSVISANTAGSGGGGADIGSGFSNLTPHLTIVDSVVTQNNTSGLFLRFGTNVITDSNISNNIGSGIFADHGIIHLEGAFLDNNGNRGVVAVDGRITVTETSVSGNGTSGVSTTGAGALVVTDSIISGNGTEGLEFTGCNAAEGKDNIIVIGSTINDNGGLAINHPGCGYTIVESSIISGNGGGIRCVTCEGVTVESSTINGNSPMGGIHFRPGWEGAGGTLVLRDAQITNNLAQDNGGGIRALAGLDGVTTQVTVLDSTLVHGNTAYGRGGGIYVDGNAAILFSSVTDNHALGSFEDPAGDGGGIYVTRGNLSVNFSTVQDNSAQGDGGAVAHDAFTGNQLSMLSAQILDNQASGFGGGVFADFSAQVVISQSTIHGNTSGAQGGGFAGLNTSAMFLASTVSDNSASGVGGGIYYRDSVLPGNPLVLMYSTVSDNNGPSGGGIFADIRSPAGVELTNSTVSGNSDNGIRTSLTTPVTLDSSTIFGNGPRNLQTEQGLLTTTQSVIAGAVGGADCMVPLATSNGYNFSGDGTCGLGLGVGDVSFGGDPLLGPLQENGGPTRTHRPLNGSPIIAMVPSFACAQDEDQRFSPRPGGTGCEPGSVELGIALPGDITTLPGLPKPLDVLDLLGTRVFDPDSLEILTHPRGGRVDIGPESGVLTYMANLDFMGEDSFAYQICRHADPEACESVTVQVLVTDLAPELCTIVGTDGPDILIGTRHDDVICGLGGDDLILGLGDNDLILGGPGNDVIIAGPGFDRIVGGDGIDHCFAGPWGGFTASCEFPRRNASGPGHGLLRFQDMP
jgi:predicted outer membrane repeat protein